MPRAPQSTFSSWAPWCPGFFSGHVPSSARGVVWLPKVLAREVETATGTAPTLAAELVTFDVLGCVKTYTYA